MHLLRHMRYAAEQIFQQQSNSKTTSFVVVVVLIVIVPSFQLPFLLSSFLLNILCCLPSFNNRQRSRIGTFIGDLVWDLLTLILTMAESLSFLLKTHKKSILKDQKKFEVYFIRQEDDLPTRPGLLGEARYSFPTELADQPWGWLADLGGQWG
jgi:hypothetical protein